MIDEGMTEEEQIARAIEMSLQESRANNTSESVGYSRAYICCCWCWTVAHHMYVPSSSLVIS
jgi:hypothetical protein